MNDRWHSGKSKALVAIVVVFIVGLLVGGFLATTLIRGRVVHAMWRERPPVHKMVAKRLTENIELSNEQRQELEKILLEYDSRFDDFERQSRQQVRAIAQEMESRMREILNPDQQEIFDRNVTRLHERFSHKNRHIGKDRP